MTWIFIAIAGWLSVAVVVGLLVWTLGRAAAVGDREAVGDRDMEEHLKLRRTLEAEQSATERRAGSHDRRTVARRWAATAPGRRQEDQLGRDLTEARRALKDAETRLQEIEARQSA